MTSFCFPLLILVVFYGCRVCIHSGVRSVETSPMSCFELMDCSFLRLGWIPGTVYSMIT